ncbi:MAG: alpha/beta hydrolase-fold protein [Bacillota bacterium]|nr:alpha/beta hydrolase-fold protein [Bacillota bacterium]
MILKFEMWIPQFRQNRRVHMYLPDDYKTANKKYPVLYMFDGHNLFEDSSATYGKSWNLPNKIKESGKELIVVGLECSHNGNDRLSEYAPFTYADSDYDGVFEGRGKDTMDFFVKSLKPYIDGLFPTKTDRENTWIGGSSCGGTMALYGIENYSDYFSKALVISPYIRPFYDHMLIQTWHAKIKKPSSVYFSWGALEGSGKHAFIQETIMVTNIANSLLDKGIEIHFNVKEEGQHCEAAWEQEAPEFIKFLFKEKETSV